MSGHNKWSKIKHKKAATDAQKSKIFSKYARLIAVESQKGRGNVNSPGLRSVIEKAKKDSMPSDNISRAIAKGVGGEGGNMVQGAPHLSSKASPITETERLQKLNIYFQKMA